MAAKYIRSTSNLSPKNVWDKLNDGSWSFDDCPWVICDNIYAAVNFTGDGSWQEIVSDLYRKGQRSFTILAGRHGDQLGQQVDTKTGKFISRDASSPGDAAINPADDELRANALKADARLPGINVLVKDVGNGAHDSVELLTREIKTHLSANRIVVLAWCYSLNAMKSGWDVNVKNSWPQVFLGPNMTPISFIARDWAWASLYPKSPASSRPTSSPSPDPPERAHRPAIAL
jgi:hypothetical protein